MKNWDKYWSYEIIFSESALPMTVQQVCLAYNFNSTHLRKHSLAYQSQRRKIPVSGLTI